MKSQILSSVLLASAALAHPLSKRQSAITDIDILQYALTLEHLEDKFYREGLANFTLSQFQDAGFDETFYNNIQEVSYDETTHVNFLTTALKGLNATPVAECTYAFGVTDVASFIATASVLEGVGVSAYLGAAASIMNKNYLTAAASILTVESRHSSYIRGGLDQSPFPQAFDAPLTFNQVYTLAAPFIKSCPDTNGKLPVKSFPSLALAGTTATSGSSITLNLAKPMTNPNYAIGYYAAWISVTGPVIVSANLKGGNQFTTTVPAGFAGESYVIITTDPAKVNDDTVVAGPAIVEIEGAVGDQ